MGNRQFGFMLSGGLDSSLIAGFFPLSFIPHLPSPQKPWPLVVFLPMAILRRLLSLLDFRTRLIWKMPVVLPAFWELCTVFWSSGGQLAGGYFGGAMMGGQSTGLHQHCALGRVRFGNLRSFGCTLWHSSFPAVQIHCLMHGRESASLGYKDSVITFLPFFQARVPMNCLARMPTCKRHQRHNSCTK